MNKPAGCGCSPPEVLLSRSSIAKGVYRHHLPSRIPAISYRSLVVVFDEHLVILLGRHER
jgi:hypothetical protein